MNLSKLAFFVSRKHQLVVTLCFSILFSVSFLFSKAQTATRTVCSSGCDYTTIQAALTASSSGDTILINVTGAHTEKNILLPEKNITIRGLGKSVTTLQAAATRTSASGGRIFSYAAPTGAGGNVIAFENMTIRHAYAPLTDLGGSQFQSAGAVFYATGGLKGLKINVRNIKFTANETTAGNNINSGGTCFYISATGSTAPYNAELVIENSDFDDNKTANSAGTSLSDGACFSLLGSPNKLSINKSTFTNNNGYTRGGILYIGSSWIVNIANSLFESNTCRNGDGGCFYAISGTLTVENSLFKNNSAAFTSAVNGNNGFGGVGRVAGAKFKNCTFFGNSALKGGALYRSNSGTNNEMQLINCTFYGNSASQQGRTIAYGSATSASAFPLVMVNTIITNGGGAAK